MYECVLSRETASERADKGSRREEEDLHPSCFDQKRVFPITSDGYPDFLVCKDSCVLDA